MRINWIENDDPTNPDIPLFDEGQCDNDCGAMIGPFLSTREDTYGREIERGEFGIFAVINGRRLCEDCAGDMRYAHVSPMGTNTGNLADAEKVIERYLPSNYSIVGRSYDSGPMIVVAGIDHAGWTLDGYVLPRLTSGMIFGKEIAADELREMA